MAVNLALLFKALSLGATLNTLRTDAIPLMREARQWYETLRTRSGTAGRTTSARTDGPNLTHELEDLRTRVEQLEADGTKQADLVAKIATQVEALTQGLQLVARRMTVLLTTSAVAIIVAVVALVVAETR